MKNDLSIKALIIFLGIILSLLNPVQAQTASKGKYVIKTFLDYKGPESENFPRAFGIAFDRNNQMFMLCGDNSGCNHVYKVSPDGKYSEIAAMKTTFSGPGIDIDKNNNIFVATGDKLFKISPKGRIDTLFNDFVKAGDVKLDTLGNLYVIDFSEYRIYKITPNLKKTLWVDHYDEKPTEFKTGGILFDPLFENLLVCDYSGNKITKYRINPDGSAGEAKQVLENHTPFWATYGPGNSVFFTDWSANIIVRFNLDNSIDTINFPNTPIGIIAGKGMFGQDTLYVTDNFGIKKLYWTNSSDNKSN
jgi:sugar lactone lactonase YvrE